MIKGAERTQYDISREHQEEALQVLRAGFVEVDAMYKVVLRKIVFW